MRLEQSVVKSRGEVDIKSLEGLIILGVSDHIDYVARVLIASFPPDEQLRIIRVLPCDELTFWEHGQSDTVEACLHKA